MDEGAGPPGALPVAPGLHLVSTPIGAARDITLRALDVLAGADVLAAEDTRTLRHLMAIHAIPLAGRRIVALHDHNESAAAEALVANLAAGGSLAYASEAGTPLVSDPGFRLVRAAIAAGVPVHAVPGASALLAALVVSGLPSDRVLFAGFAPSTQAARLTWLAEVMATPATQVIYENPTRVRDLLEAVCEIDPNRGVVICRELTKRFEEVQRGTASALAESVRQKPLRGEVVVLLDRAPPRAISDEDARQMLRRLLDDGLSTRDAVDEVVSATGLKRRAVYQMAMEAQ